MRKDNASTMASAALDVGRPSIPGQRQGTTKGTHLAEARSQPLADISWKEGQRGENCAKTRQEAVELKSLVE